MLQRFLMLLLQRLDFQADQLVQAHFQDRRRLPLGKPEHGRHLFGNAGLELDVVGDTVDQTVSRVLHGLASPKDLDDQVDHVTGLDQPFLNLLALQLLGKEGLIFSRSQFKLEIHVMLDDRFQPQCLRPAVCHGQHIDAKGILQPGLLVEHIFQVFDICALFQLQHDPDTFLGGLVGNVHDIRRLFRLHKAGHIIEKFSDPASDHGVGDLRDDKLFLAAFEFLSLHLAPQLDLPLAGLVDIQQLVLIHHDPSGGEIRSFYIAHELFGADLVILHISLDRIDHLAQVMGGNAGGHSHRNALRAVDQKVGYTHREHQRFLLCLVKIGAEIYHIFIQVGQVRLLGKL